jgi:hypothetical protein
MPSPTRALGGKQVTRWHATEPRAARASVPETAATLSLSPGFSCKAVDGFARSPAEASQGHVDGHPLLRGGGRCESDKQRRAVLRIVGE